MTIETLKTNREEIIETITNKVGSEMVKDVMGMMVKMIGYRGAEDMNVKQFINLTIESNNVKPYQKQFTPTWLLKGFDSQQHMDYTNQRGSSMR